MKFICRQNILFGLSLYVASYEIHEYGIYPLIRTFKVKQKMNTKNFIEWIM